MNPRTSLSRLFSLAALLAGVGTACIEPVGDIDRTQPGYVNKDIFSGEWYMRHSIVDKQFQTSAVFTGYEGGLDRVRWEITQNHLIAYRSYERVPGTEGANGGEETVLAVYPIRSHFDRRREYNPVNGVESNVWVENTNDRPWWEREFIRVDWTQNQVPDWDLNGLVRAYANPFAPATTRNNDGNDPTDPWRVRVVEDAATGEVNYIEVTTDAFADVDAYACLVAAEDWYANCGGGVIRLKTAFRKLDPTNDYEPQAFPDYLPVRYGSITDPLTGNSRLCYEDDDGCTDVTELWVTSGPLGTELCDPNVHDPDSCYQYTTPMFSKFGYFRTDRYVYDRENGYTLTGRERLINRWNIWQRSRDERGNPIPFAQRQTKEIVYYTNVHFPPELLPVVQEMAADWDVAFRDTVANLQGKTLDEVDPIYVVRVNDCNIDNVNRYIEKHQDAQDFRTILTENGIGELGFGNLENACAVLEHYSEKAGLDDIFRWQQLGDLRYSFVTWLPKAEIAGPLGYGPSAADPITGEIISANANIYGASVDTYASLAADYVDYINGVISTEDVINGTHVREHIESVRARYRDPTSAADVQRFLNLFDRRTGGMSDERYLKTVPLTSINENLDRLADSGFEEQFLLNTDVLQSFAGGQVLDGSPVSQALVDRARPSTWGRDFLPANLMSAISPADDGAMALRGLSTEGKLSAAERLQRRVDFLGRQNFCFLEGQMEPALADLAAQVAERGLSRDQLVLLARSEILRGVLAHEVGHTIGLRHNFEGSSDALNFFPDYWGVDTGDHRMAKSERRSEVEYSTIMDYHQRFNSDWAGIGLYDKAAVKFGYGQLVEVFDEGRFDLSLNDHEDRFVPRDWDNSLNLFYPSDLPYLLAGGNANNEINTLYDEVYEQLIAGDPNVFMDVKSTGIVPKPENLFKRKNITFSDYRRQEVWRIFGRNIAPPSPENARPLIEVPYSFCSDAYAWGGNLSCNRWDKGTTSEEIVQNAKEMYDFYYPFQSFRGERRWDSYYNDPVNGYIGRLYERTYQPMLTAFRYFYYYRRSTASIWPLIRDWAAASYQGMNFFGRVLQTPEPGRYCLRGDWYVPEASASGEECSANAIDLPMGDARYFETKWTQENDLRPQNIGHIWDKIVAIQSMTSSNAFFFRDFSNFFSRGAFSIGYYRVFQPEMLRLYNGLIMGNRDAYAAHVNLVGGEPRLEFNSLITFPGDQQGVPTGVRIQPSDSYMMRYYAMFFAMANLSSNVDFTLDFAQRSRIALEGSQHDPVIDPSVEQIVFTDPTTHYRYRASAPDGAELSLGYLMLKDASDFVNDGSNGDEVGPWFAAKLALDEAELADDEAATAAAREVFRAAERALNEKVQLIDQVRQLADVLEYGN